MASPNLSNPAFLVFSSLNPVFTWRVVAIETNRTISSHKRLDNAVRKAERLNVEALDDTCENCNGTGCVVSGSWSDVADQRCDECRGTGVHRG